MARLRLGLLAAAVIAAGCTRPSEPTTATAAPADPVPATRATPAERVRVTPTAFRAGDRFEVTSKLVMAHADVRVETSCRYEVRITEREGERVKATITLTRDETVVVEGARRTVKAHPGRTIAFAGSPRELALIGTKGKGALVSSHLPAELVRDGVRDGITWTGARRLDVAGFPLELDVRSTAQLRRDGRVEVTTTSRGERAALQGITLTIEGESVSAFDRDAADLPRSLRGRFTTRAAGGPGDDARTTVAIDVRTRRIA